MADLPKYAETYPFDTWVVAERKGHWNSRDLGEPLLLGALIDRDLAATGGRYPRPAVVGDWLRRLLDDGCIRHDPDGDGGSVLVVVRAPVSRIEDTIGMRADSPRLSIMVLPEEGFYLLVHATTGHVMSSPIMPHLDDPYDGVRFDVEGHLREHGPAGFDLVALKNIRIIEDEPEPAVPGI